MDNLQARQIVMTNSFVPFVPSMTHRAEEHDRLTKVLPLRGLCPTTHKINDYDRRNFRLYTWLLIEWEDGATIDELASGIFGFDLSHDTRWARRVTASHLARAYWVHNSIWPLLD